MKNQWLISESDRLYMITEPEIIEDVSQVSDDIRELVLALTKGKEDSDLLWFSGIYCTADVRNYNGDGFLYDDLRAASNTPKLKPVNWLHREMERIGVIVTSEFVETGNKSGNIRVVGVVWNSAQKDMEYVDEIKRNYAKGRMGLSMECFGTAVQCSVCGKEFPIQNSSSDEPYSHYCEHLKNRRVSKNTVRWIRDPHFVGVGFIPAIMRHQPADETAWVKEIAARNDANEYDKGVKRLAEYTKEQVDELVEAAKKKYEYDSKMKCEEHEKAAKDKEAELERLKKLKEGLDKKIEELETAKATADAEVERLTTELAEKKASDEEVQALRDELEAKKAAVAEYEEYKAQKEAEVQAAIQAKYDERSGFLKDKAGMTAEQAETLREHILDDAKFEALKKTMVKEVEKPKGTKISFESDHKTADAAQKLRELTHKGE